MIRSSIKIGDKSYPLEITGEVIPKTESLVSSGLLCRTFNEKTGDVLGCITVHVSGTTAAVWNNNWGGKKLTKEGQIALYSLLLPHLYVPIGIHKLQELYTECVKVVLWPNDPGYNQNENTLYVRGELNPEELVKRIVYGDTITDPKVEIEIIKILHSYRLEKGAEVSMRIEELVGRMFISKDTILRCLDFLENQGKIKANKDTSKNWVSVKIAPDGVRFFRNNFKESKKGGDTHIMKIGKVAGDVAGRDMKKNITMGNQSPIIDSGDISVINNYVDKLTDAIEKGYDGKDKDLIIEEVKEVKELASDAKNHPKIRKILGNVIAKGAEVATITAAAAQLLSYFGVTPDKLPLP
jgi:DNA-binding PadR family transcriptional regulator